MLARSTGGGDARRCAVAGATPVASARSRITSTNRKQALSGAVQLLLAYSPFNNTGRSPSCVRGRRRRRLDNSQIAEIAGT